MRDVLAAHARQQGVRYRLRDATESTTSERSWCGGVPGRQRRIFPSGAPAVGRSGRFPFLAWPSRGWALGHEGTSPALAMSGDFPVTPRVTACTASGGRPVLDAAGGPLTPRHRPPPGASRRAPPPRSAPPWASGARRGSAPRPAWRTSAADEAGRPPRRAGPTVSRVRLAQLDLVVRWGCATRLTAPSRQHALASVAPRRPSSPRGRVGQRPRSCRGAMSAASPGIATTCQRSARRSARVGLACSPYDQPAPRPWRPRGCAGGSRRPCGTLSFRASAPRLCLRAPRSPRGSSPPWPSGWPRDDLGVPVGGGLPGRLPPLLGTFVAAAFSPASRRSPGSPAAAAFRAASRRLSGPFVAAAFLAASLRASGSWPPRLPAASLRFRRASSVSVTITSCRLSPSASASRSPSPATAAAPRPALPPAGRPTHEAGRPLA